MILAGPHDRFAQLAHGGPGPVGRFPPLFHFPACTSGVLAAIVTPANPPRQEAGDRPPRLPTAEPECSAEAARN
jgi:hypothetical protein